MRTGDLTRSCAGNSEEVVYYDTNVVLQPNTIMMQRYLARISSTWHLFSKVWSVTCLPLFIGFLRWICLCSSMILPAQRSCFLTCLDSIDSSYALPSTSECRTNVVLHLSRRQLTPPTRRINFPRQCDAQSVCHLLHVPGDIPPL